MAAKTAMIRARIEPNIKEAAEKVFKKLGISVTEAISLFYNQVSMTKSIQFEARIPNRKTVKALREIEKGKTKIFNNVEDLMRDLNA